MKKTPRGLYCKTLQSCNLHENDKVCSKLAHSSLDKNTSVDKQKHKLAMKSVNYKSIMFYSPSDRTQSYKIFVIKILKVSPVDTPSQVYYLRARRVELTQWEIKIVILPLKIKFPSFSFVKMNSKTFFCFPLIKIKWHFLIRQIFLGSILQRFLRT